MFITKKIQREDTKKKNQKKTRLRGLMWGLTFSNCEISKQKFGEVLLEKFNIAKLVIGREEHKNGTHHLHCYLKLSRNLDVRNLDYFNVVVENKEYKCNVTKVNKTAGWLLYITKHDKEPFCHNMDLSEALKGSAKTRNEVFNALRLNQISLDEAVMVMPNLLCRYDAISRSLKSYNAAQEDKSDKFINKICFWISGKSNIGKTTQILNFADDVYLKTMDKWWPEYEGQKVVLIEEINPNISEEMKNLLKIWANNYTSIGEIKGGNVSLKFEWLFITSNYRLNEIFYGDEKNYNAIKRRYIEINAEEFLVDFEIEKGVYKSYFSLQHALVKMKKELEIKKNEQERLKQILKNKGETKEFLEALMNHIDDLQLQNKKIADENDDITLDYIKKEMEAIKKRNLINDRVEVEKKKNDLNSVFVLKGLKENDDKKRKENDEKLKKIKETFENEEIDEEDEYESSFIDDSLSFSNYLDDESEASDEELFALQTQFKLCKQKIMLKEKLLELYKGKKQEESTQK